MSLDIQARKEIYSRVRELVLRKHFNPGMNGADWDTLVVSREDRVLRSVKHLLALNDRLHL